MICEGRPATDWAALSAYMLGILYTRPATCCIIGNETA